MSLDMVIFSDFVLVNEKNTEKSRIEKLEIILR